MARKGCCEQLVGFGDGLVLVVMTEFAGQDGDDRYKLVLKELNIGR